MRRFSKVARGLEYTATLLSLCVVLQSVGLASSREKQQERPRILGIDHVSVYVSDVEKSGQFYSEVLGLTTHCPQYAASEPCYLVAPSNQRVLLKRAPAQTKNGTLKNWLAEVAFATDDLMGMRRYLLTLHDPSKSATRRVIPSRSYIDYPPKSDAGLLLSRSVPT